VKILVVAMHNEIIKSKAVTNGTRHEVKVASGSFGKVQLPKYYYKGVSRIGGRNNAGRLVVNGRGGAQGRKRLRLLSKGNREDQYKLVTVIRDPGRSAPLAIWERRDKLAYAHHSLGIAPAGFKEGDMRYISNTITARESKLNENIQSARLRLRNITLASEIHDVELKPNAGGQIARSAGSYMIFHGIYQNKARVAFPSGRRRLLDPDCLATTGRVAGRFHRKIVLGRAGANRGRGSRSKVRGSTMNPVDHPHGGGEGKSGPGRPSVTPWGRITLGVKTSRASSRIDW
jgi:large subunit ribosomal protein L2